jgi:thioredoxin reductase (NADPH)
VAGPVVRLVGSRASAAAYAIRDFLARNLIPYEWVEVSDQDAAKTVLGLTAGDESRLPLCVLPDGTRLEAPTIDEVAAGLGLVANARLGEYDIAIIGAGPAGLAAAVYGASDGLRTVVFEGVAPGGQAGSTALIENYLGFPEGISGAELAKRAQEQARRFGAELLLLRRVEHVKPADGAFVTELSDGTAVKAHAVIGATGVAWRRVDLPGIEALLGRGVYYGASPGEAPWCRDETVVIVGGGNSAGQAAIYYSGYARAVTMIVRDAALDETMSKYLVDRIAATPNIEVRTNRRVTGVRGDDRLRAVTVVDDQRGEEYGLDADALFICIGGEPRSEWAADLGLSRDRSGYVVTGSDLGPGSAEHHRFPLETSLPGIFAAGDVRSGSVKRISAAIGEGAMAVALTHRYLAKAGHRHP